MSFIDYTFTYYNILYIRRKVGIFCNVHNNCKKNKLHLSFLLFSQHEISKNEIINFYTNALNLVQLNNFS